MKIIKECVIPHGNQTHKLVVIRNAEFDITLEKILELYNKALEDFPDLKTKDVHAQKYHGGSQDRTNGIEFLVQYNVTVPNDYKLIGQAHECY